MDDFKKMSEELTLEKIGQVGGTIIAASFLLWFVRRAWRGHKIRQRIHRKQQQVRESIQHMQDVIDKNGVPKERAEFITGLTFNQLHAKLQTGELKALEVCKAFMAKALEKNQHLNFIVEPVRDALKIAEKLDSEKIKRPLHGVPVSIKENYFIQGYDSTGGQSSLLNKPAKQHGVMVNTLLELGCVPLVRTNIPQSMMTFECSNPIYGITCNPHNLERGPGGSSGGEGCILGAEASVLGWGSDIGGSVRIPSHFCGVCCLKPTAGRLGFASTEELVYGQNLVLCTVAPMARDVDTLVTAMKNVLTPALFEQEHSIPPMPLNMQLYESRQSLRIGYYEDDGNVPPIPGVKRGFEEAKAALKSMGHTLVPFTVPDVDHMFGDLFCGATFADGATSFLAQMADDEIDSSISLIVRTYQLPRFVLGIIAKLADWFSGERIPGKMLRNMSKQQTALDNWKLEAEIEAYKRKFHSLWKASRLDAVICPTFPYVAPPTGCVKHILGGATYTTLYNVLNYPAGCVPVTKVTAIDELAMKDYPTYTQSLKMVKKYFSSNTGGLPVTVQCVALPYQEEMVLRVMKDLEMALKGEQPSQGPARNTRSKRK